MANYAYLRVSRDTQDVAAQRYGLLDYAHKNGHFPFDEAEETVSRAIPWRSRELGKLFEKVVAGDVILTSEFSRLGSSPAQVLGFLEEAALKGVVVIATKTKTVMDGSISSKIQASAFSMASMIELEFTRARTMEGLARARQEGRVGGRPKGSTGGLKLDSKKEQVGELVLLGLSIPKLARQFSVTEKTMRKFVARNFPEHRRTRKPKKDAST